MKQIEIFKKDLKKFFKNNSTEFVDEICNLYVLGVKLEYDTNIDETPTAESEARVIIHFCTSEESYNPNLNYVLQKNPKALTEWFVFKKELLSDDEAYAMYNILINSYIKIFKL